jgi:transcriptional regulator with XRE-family HTH domain
MRTYSEAELQLINIQIGCMLRLARLKQKLSQFALGVKIDYTSTMIGRIERFENVSGWDKIYTISQYLNVDYCRLFVLKSKESLLSIVEESFKLEEKLTQEKIDYYNFLKKTIINKFDLLEKESIAKM